MATPVLITLVFAALAMSAVSGIGSVSAHERDPSIERAEPDHQEPHRPLFEPRSPMAVSLIPIGPSSISIGEPLRFALSSGGPSFGHLYVLSASGKVQLWMENVPLRGNRPLLYPTGNRIVRAAPPSGDERVIFLATCDRIRGFAGGRTVITPSDTQLSHAGFSQRFAQLTFGMPRRHWSATEIAVRVVDR